MASAFDTFGSLPDRSDYLRMRISVHVYALVVPYACIGQGGQSVVLDALAQDFKAFQALSRPDAVSYVLRVLPDDELLRHLVLSHLGLSISSNI